MFSEPEIQFLMQSHKVETADKVNRCLAAVSDLRNLGCPASVFNRVLEDRARKLGSRFVEWRNRRGETTPPDDLSQRIQGSKLF